MLVVSNITIKHAGADEALLKNISFTVNGGERVGLIGPNGTGKTTLIQIIMGRVTPDSGSVQFNPPNVRVGYLAQGMEEADDVPIRTILYPHLDALHAAELEVEKWAEALANPDGDFDAALVAYGEALERFEVLHRQTEVGRGEAILAGLGLGDLSLDTPAGILSGGQKTRLGLAGLLLSEPQLLILDEPTNHLDITALEWLEEWLANFKGAALLVSHDRTFLDRTVTKIVAIDDQKHTARTYEGNYRDYASAAQSELDKQWAAWRQQQAEIARIKADIQRMMNKMQGHERAKKFSEDRAKKAMRVMKARESKLDRYIDSDERVEKPVPGWNMRMDLSQAALTGQDVLYLEGLTVGYDFPLLSDLNLSIRAGERVALVGPNGHGKSTLIKTIVGELPALGGRVRMGPSVKVGYLAQEQEILDPNSTPFEVIQASAPFNHNEARYFLHLFLFKADEVFWPIHQLSFGERARLMLARVVARGANLLILDEPINHLDVPSRENFEQALRNFEGSVIAVVHDRYFVEQFATTVWTVADGGLQVDVVEPMME